MSEGFTAECKRLWGDLDQELGEVLGQWYLGSGGNTLLGSIQEAECNQRAGSDMAQAFLKDWRQELEKLKEKNKQLENLEKLRTDLSSAQQSGASSVAI